MEQSHIPNGMLLLNNHHLSDINFIVGQEKFYAHKVILCKCSRYFRHLLSGAFNEMKGLELEIEIRDYPPVVFFKILQFIYTGSFGDLDQDLKGDVGSLLSLLDASMVYELDAMQKKIEEYIANFITVPNVTSLWRFAIETGAHILAAKCQEFFRAHSEQISQAPDFSNQLWNSSQDLLANCAPCSLNHPSCSSAQHSPSSEQNSSSFEDLENFLLKEEVNIGPHNPETDFDHFVKSLLFQEERGSSESTPESHGSQEEHEHHQGHGLSVPHGLILHHSHSHSAPIIHPTQNNNALSPPSQVFHPNSINGTKNYTETGSIETHSISLGTDAMSISTTSPNISAPPHAPPPDLTNKPPPPSYKELSSRKDQRRTLLQGPIWAKALEKMALLIEVIRDIVQADIGTLFLYDNGSNELYSHVTHPTPIEIAIPSYLGIAGAVFQSGKTINCSSAYTDPRFYSGIDRQTGTPTLAILAVPIFGTETPNKPIGVIELLNKKRKTVFNEENEKEVFMICRMVAKIIEKATADSKLDIEKKGNKRAANSEDNGKPSTKKRRVRDRTTIPVFHFKTPKQTTKGTKNV